MSSCCGEHEGVLAVCRTARVAFAPPRLCSGVDRGVEGLVHGGGTLRRSLMLPGAASKLRSLHAGALQHE